VLVIPLRKPRLSALPYLRAFLTADSTALDTALVPPAT
jgi:hypothetical protein